MSYTVRIASVLTSEIKRVRSINLKASKSSNHCKKRDVYEEIYPHDQDHYVADICDSGPEVVSTISASDFPQHQCTLGRRLKECARWEDIMETLLSCRIEEAAFFSGDIVCCDYESDAETRGDVWLKTGI